MSDDQGTKSTTIDNLIDELTKQKTPQPAPFSPKPVMPPPFVPRPAPQPAPAIPSTGATPIPPASPVKEYQSSIRTMGEDLSSLKTGQKPSGVSVPRTVEPPKPALPEKPVLPKPPVAPSVQFPQVKLGEAQKTGPLPGQKPQLPKPSIPAPSPEAPKISIPTAGAKFIGGNLLYLGIMVVVLLAGAAYWYFVIRTPSLPEAVVTPTPIVTAPPEITLNQLMGSATPVLIDLSVSIDSLADFNNGFKTQTLLGGELKGIDLQTGPDLQMAKSITNFLDKFLIAYPAGLKENSGKEFSAFMYGQKENFTAKGELDIAAVNVKKLILVSEIDDLSLAASIAKEWEPSMAEDLKGLFNLDVKKSSGASFTDNMYRGIDIKFMNFPYPDKSIDYTVFTASNGKAYFVITGSREAMYEATDKLK